MLHGSVVSFLFFYFVIHLYTATFWTKWFRLKTLLQSHSSRSESFDRPTSFHSLRTKLDGLNYLYRISNVYFRKRHHYCHQDCICLDKYFFSVCKQMEWFKDFFPHSVIDSSGVLSFRGNHWKCFYLLYGLIFNIFMYIIYVKKQTIYLDYLRFIYYMHKRKFVTVKWKNR